MNKDELWEKIKTITGLHKQVEGLTDEIERLEGDIVQWKMECCDWQDYNTKLQTEIEKAISGFVMERECDCYDNNEEGYDFEQCQRCNGTKKISRQPTVEELAVGLRKGTCFRDGNGNLLYCEMPDGWTLLCMRELWWRNEWRREDD